MVVVDASVITSVYVLSDEYHFASRSWLRAHILAGDTLIAPMLLAVEVAAAIARRTDELRGQRALHGLLQLSALRLVTINRDVHLHATALASTLRLRGADSIYVAVADRLRVPLVSWDREHVERATARIVVYRPGETAGTP